MNQNYPEYILRYLRQRHDMEEDDTSRDDEFQQLSPKEALEECLEWEGIFGYTSWILILIKDIYKIKLEEDFYTMSKADFVQGLGNLFAAQDDMDEVRAMRMDENELVTVTFRGGGTKKANVAMDSRKAIISDIIKQAL